jgi:uncharacterized protein YecE (DUF72 family)
MAARGSKRDTTSSSGRIRVGIGGWTFEPWRGVFYPKGLAHARELEFASGKLGAIEINGTFYRTQKPATFRQWRDQTPADFVFSVKAVRFATHRRVLAEAGDSVKRFMESGVTELGDKLGPILWQLMPTAKFDAGDLEAFLKLLPAKQDGRAIRHVLEVRHESFAHAAFVDLLRAHNVAVVAVESDKHAPIHDATADFVYLRLERTVEKEPAGYAPKALDAWAARLKALAAGQEPEGLVRHASAAPVRPRDVFAYFISGAKIRNPAAAMAMIERLI